MRLSKVLPLILCLTSGIGAAEMTTTMSEITSLPQINGVTSFDQIPWDTLNTGDIVVFDIYGVLISSSSDHNIMHNINAAERSKFLNQIRQMGGEERVSFAFDQVNFGLIDSTLPRRISDLNDRGVYTMAITVSRTGIPAGQTISSEEMLSNRLTKVGIKLTPPVDEGNYSFLNSLEVNKQKIAEAGKESFQGNVENLLVNGIFMTNNRFKVEPLAKLLSLNILPSKIVMIDKTKGPLEDMLKAFPGVAEVFHYTESHRYSLDEDVVKVQLTSLLHESPTFPTDAEARK